MRKYVFIGMGGFAGAVLRAFTGQLVIWNSSASFPVNTLLINVCGAFLLAFFLTLALDVLKVDADIRLGIATGFFGAFTTFSTLCKEAVGLMRLGAIMQAVYYMTASAVLGLLAAWLGMALARKTSLLKARENGKADQEVLHILGDLIKEEDDMSK